MTDLSALLLFVRIKPDWSRIEQVRDGVGKLLASALGEERAGTVAMVCSELLENGVKYGACEGSSVTLSLEETNEALIIEVENCQPSPGALAALEAHIGWLRSFSSPADAYLASLHRVFERATAVIVEGKLGLARVAFEGGCELSYREPKPGWLAVRAVYRTSTDLAS